MPWIILEGIESRWFVPIEMYIRIAIVFNNHTVVFLRQRDQFKSSCTRHDRTRWILVGRQCVDNARPFPLPGTSHSRVPMPIARRRPLLVNRIPQSVARL